MNFGDFVHDLQVSAAQAIDKLFASKLRKCNRRSSRIVSDVPVEYTVLDGDLEGYKAMVCEVGDISNDGINALIDKQLPKFTILQLRILLSARTAITLRGSIAWQEPEDDSRNYRSGIKFVNVTPDAADKLQEYLKPFSL